MIGRFRLKKGSSSSRRFQLNSEGQLRIGMKTPDIGLFGFRRKEAYQVGYTVMTVRALTIPMALVDDNSNGIRSRQDASRYIPSPLQILKAVNVVPRGTFQAAPLFGDAM